MKAATAWIEQRIHLTRWHLSLPVDGTMESEASAGSESGNRRATDQLMEVLYDELRVQAHRHMARERDTHTLQPTALVHEAFLKLADARGIDWQGPTHFKALAATTLRRVLVDHARRHKAKKRGEGAKGISVHEDDAITWSDPSELIALDEALERLSAKYERPARVVECRFLGGLSRRETAEALGISEDTVKSDWRFARSWLNRALRDGGPGSGA